MNGTIKKLKDALGNYVLPVTRAEAVFTNDKTPLSSDLTYYSGRTKQNYMGKIRVCSYNSEHLHEEISTIQSWLKRKQIHHLGLQEIYNSIQPVNDLKFLDYESPLYTTLGWGILMMSVYKPLSFTQYQNQSDPNPTDDRLRRMLIKYETYIHGKKVSIYNTHISADATGVAVQYEINKVIQTMNSDTNQYKILTGDFNVPATSYFDPFVTNGYKICNGKDGIWFDTFIPPAYGTTQAIDNIIVTSNIDILNVERDEELTMSDHHALIADLVLK